MSNIVHNHVTLPRDVYYEIRAIVKSYEDLKLQRHAILNATAAPSGTPGGSGKIPDPTGETAARLENVTRKIRAIESSINRIEAAYRKGVWNNCLHGSRFPSYADKKTWYEYKRDFFYYIAEDLGILN